MDFLTVRDHGIYLENEEFQRLFDLKSSLKNHYVVFQIRFPYYTAKLPSELAHKCALKTIRVPLEL